MAAYGKLLGAIDISGDQRSRHPHTLGLVGMVAHMIENRLVIANCRRDATERGWKTRVNNAMRK